MVGGSLNVPCGWCSDALRWTASVAPQAQQWLNQEMSECDKCGVKFTLLKRKHPCSSCGLNYCSSCLKRTVDGTRQCQKCLILAQWPLDVSRITGLRVKDLRHFLHTKHVNTQTCTEKKDLVDLVVNYITSQHKTDSSGIGANTSRSSPHVQPSRFHPDVSSQDGIRVRSYSASATSNSNSSNSASSIRVRPGPLDSIRVRPTPTFKGRDEQKDLGIRVFGSSRTEEDGIRVRAGSTSPVSEEAAGVVSKDSSSSQCHSEDCTSSSCSLEFCNVQADASISKQNSNLEEEDPASFFRTDTPDQSAVRESVSTLSSPDQQNGSVSTQEADKIESDSPQMVQGEDSVPEQDDSSAQVDVVRDEVTGAHIEDEVQNQSSNSHVADEDMPREDEEDSSESSSASAAEAKQTVKSGPITLEDIKSEEDLLGLTVRQCKELLALHRVNYSGVREKQELVARVRLLWQDNHKSKKDVEMLPEELVCKICMDSAIDCVFLECGHMVACTPCGKQMAECPVCRQYVVRIVRTFRA